MATIIKLLILVLVALLVFFKSIFASSLLYWGAFALAFALLPLWWLAEYWVSKSKAAGVLGSEPEQSFFASMVSDDVYDDLKRGRFCVTADKAVLVAKRRGKYQIEWSENISEITNAVSAKVAGVRKGFIVYTKDGETSFVCNLADEVIKAILKS